MRFGASFLSVLAVFSLGLASCGNNEPTEPIDVARLETLIEAFSLAPLPELEYPQYNRYNPDRIRLGRLLFFDPILGGESAPWIKSAAGKAPYRDRTDDVACGTCHHPAFHYGDGTRLARGTGAGSVNGEALGDARSLNAVSSITGRTIPPVARNSLTIVNAALNGLGTPASTNESFQFMDGRVTLGLEFQALAPFTVREEMAGDAYGRDLLGDALGADAVRDSLAARVRAVPGYEPLFIAAYPEEITSANDIRISHVSKALAAFERELRAPDSRYDRFVSGDYGVFTSRERRGFELFFGKAACGECHHGPMLSDYDFHVQGVADDYDELLPGFGGKDGDGHDFGRFHADPEEFADRRYAFRTLTVREVAGTGPYFHSGNAATLHAVVAFYNRGGLGPDDISDAELMAAGAERDPSIRPLGLTDPEIDALVAFMLTTTGTLRPGPDGLDLSRVPERVPSGLLPPGIPTPEGNGPFLPSPDPRAGGRP